MSKRIFTGDGGIRKPEGMRSGWRAKPLGVVGTPSAPIKRATQVNHDDLGLRNPPYIGQETNVGYAGDNALADERKDKPPKTTTKGQLVGKYSAKNPSFLA